MNLYSIAKIALLMLKKYIMNSLKQIL